MTTERHLKKYDPIILDTNYNVGPVTHLLTKPNGIKELKDASKELARELYFTENDEVIFWLVCNPGKKQLFFLFDNPYFAFDGMQAI